MSEEEELEIIEPEEEKTIVVFKVEGGEKELKAVSEAIKNSLETDKLVIPEHIHIEVNRVPKEATFVVQNVHSVHRFPEKYL